MSHEIHGKLPIELVPLPLWGKNLHKTLKRSEWDTIRKTVYARQNYACGICGTTDSQLFCHEQWEYDDETHTQTLVGFIAICAMCNNCAHLGMSGKLVQQGYVKLDDIVEHYMRVNNCTRETFDKDKKTAFDLWSTRSDYIDWKQEISDYRRFL